MKYVPKALEQIGHSQKLIFRGHAKAGWELKPSIGRHYIGEWKNILKKEKKTLEQFRLRCVPFIKTWEPIVQNEAIIQLECLSLMQHYGCPTRLLDFTTNPLVALFFASDPSEEGDGAVIVTEVPDNLEERVKDAFKQRKPFLYQPSHISERVVGQSGCFIVCPKPNEQLKLTNYKKIVVQKSWKGHFRRELAVMGINHSTLFPGLNGICLDLKDILVGSLEEQALFDQFGHLL